MGIRLSIYLNNRGWIHKGDSIRFVVTQPGSVQVSEMRNVSREAFQKFREYCELSDLRQNFEEPDWDGTTELDMIDKSIDWFF